jgi:Putative lumazine-binding
MGPPRSRRAWVFAVPIVAAVVAATAVILISGDDEGGDGTVEDLAAPGGDPPAPFPDKDSAGSAGAPADGEDVEREVERAAREYLEAIDAGDGARVCAVLAPGAIQNLELPRERAGCAPALDDSIGYRDPRGYPVFDSARVEAIKDVTLGAGQARVTATVVTRFADRDQPSIEDDLIYLVELDGEWRVVKPSATLYRAVGKPEAPPQVIAPPG